MEEIKEFSKEVCEAIRYYVYRLIDPRNGQTFYVGKGKNNRVFAHANGALKDYKDVDYNPDDDDEISLKYETIRKIKEEGLEVINIIERYDLDEKEAFLIESVLIDRYNLDRKLTNKKRGFNATDPINALTLEKNFKIKEYDEKNINFDYVIIKVKDYWLAQRNEDRYETTRSSWVANYNKIKNIKYVLSVTQGIVKEVYKVDNWYETPWGRVEFTGKVAEENIRKLFKDKKIPAKYRKKGNANPLLYSNKKDC